MAEPRFRSIRAAMLADLGRAFTMAAGGALAFAPVEYALTLWAYSGSIELTSKLRLAALTITLSLFLWLGLSVALGGAMVIGRLWRAVFDPVGARGIGWFAPSPPVEGVRPGVPRLWALFGTIGIVALV